MTPRIIKHTVSDNGMKSPREYPGLPFRGYGSVSERREGALLIMPQNAPERAGLPQTASDCLRLPQTVSDCLRLPQLENY